MIQKETDLTQERAPEIMYESKDRITPFKPLRSANERIGYRQNYAIQEANDLSESSTEQ